MLWRRQRFGFAQILLISRLWSVLTMIRSGCWSGSSRFRTQGWSSVMFVIILGWSWTRSGKATWWWSTSIWRRRSSSIRWSWTTWRWWTWRTSISVRRSWTSWRCVTPSWWQPPPIRRSRPWSRPWTSTVSRRCWSGWPWSHAGSPRHFFFLDAFLHHDFLGLFRLGFVLKLVFKFV